MASRLPPVRKSLGQHFLADKKVLEKIADAASIQATDTVVEIGPGRGALTDILVERAGHLVAIEYDRALAAHLRERYASRANVEIIQADVLTVDLAEAARTQSFKLIGNVPYYITTPILFHALAAPRPELAIYLVQREVADRLTASPGGGEFGALTVNVGAVANVAMLFSVPAGAFRPPPKVESAVVRITERSTPLLPAEQEESFRTFVQSVFSMRRKQLQRILRAVRNLDPDTVDQGLAAEGIDPMARPETLSIEQFVGLFARFATPSRDSSARS
jgi:16S rRNA (adenine1518-N6/adenine1519-N6)-dimethyltransferase